MGVDIRKPLKQFAHYFLEARDNNLNEADTVALLCKFFVDVLGYDAIADIGHEVRAKEKWLDLTLKVDGNVKHVVEAKGAGLKLRHKFVEQAYVYATQNNYKWVLLTNGVDWNLYHLTLDEDGLIYEIAFEVSVEPDKVDDAADKLALLHKKAVKKDELQDYWKRYSAIRPGSIGKALFQDCVLKLLRTEIHRDTGLLINCEDLANALHEMLSQKASDEIGPLKIRHHKALSKKGAKRNQPADGRPSAVMLQPATALPSAGNGNAPGSSAP